MSIHDQLRQDVDTVSYRILAYERASNIEAF